LKKILAGAALLLGISSVAIAQTATAPNPIATRRGFEVGGQIAHYHYEEPDFAKLIGNRAGLVGAYTFPQRWDRVFFRVDGRGSHGALKYQGSGTQDSVPDLIIETRGVAGMDFFPGNRVSLSPYLGLGYRYLYNDLRGRSSTNAVGYRRYSNYLYAPVGVTIRFDLGNRWVLAPTVEADIFILGKQKSQLSDANLGLNDVTNTQKRGSGYRGYLMVEKDHLAFGAWTHYWNIKDSDVQPIGLGRAGLEPANWTRESGIEFRYRF
jgi:opacity protein-like surface antigen